MVQCQYTLSSLTITFSTMNTCMLAALKSERKIFSHAQNTHTFEKILAPPGNDAVGDAVQLHRRSPG